MKKIISTLMIIAAAAISFSSCQKQEMIAPEASQEVTLTFASEKPAFADETKTEWNGETIQWSEGDKIRVAYTAGGVWQNADGNATVDEENGSKTAKIYASNSVEAGEIASFSLPGSFTITTGVDLEFYGVYPSTASGADMPYAPSVTVTIPAEQKPLKNSFDSKADLMAARSVSTYILTEGNPLPEAIPLMWTRLVAHGHFTIKNLAVAGEEDIKSIVLTANDEADMVGQHYLYLDTYNVVKPSANTAPNKLTIDATNLTIADSSVSFWACFLPCTWTSVTVQVETDKATYTREIDLTANQKTFAKNARNTLSINMATATRDEKEVSVGTLPFVKDFSGNSGTTSITELDGFTVEGSVYNASGAVRLAKGDNGGSIKTQLLDLSENFHVKVTASGWDSDELILSVSAGEHSETVALTAVGNGNSGPGECVEHIINFQPVSNSSSVTFAAEAGKRCYIKKIEILEGHAVAAPVLKADTPTEIAAEGGEGSFTFTLENPKEGGNVTAVANVDWITDVTVGDGHVTYNVAENTSDESREGTVTLSYEGAQSINIVVTQEGKAPETGGQVEAQETLTFSSRYSSNTVLKGQTVQATNFNVSFAGDGTSAQYYTNGTAVRAYAKNTFTVSSNNTIVKVVITFGSSDGSNAITTDIGSYQNETWTGSSKSVKFTVGGTSGNRRISAITVHYLNSTSGDGNEGGETPDPNPTPTTYTYTFTSNAWADDTNSWTSGKNGNQLTSGRGVQVTTGVSGANATCKTSMNNVQKVVFVYSTNASNGAGSIKVSIGNEEKTLSVTKTGGTTDRNLEFDYSDSPLSGQLKFTVTCTTNSIYVKSISIIAD